MDFFAFKEDFGFGFGKEQEEAVTTPAETEVANVEVDENIESSFNEVAYEESQDMEDPFSDLGFASDSFFEVPKKGKAKKADETESKPAKKESKAKNEVKSDKEVNIPVVVRARNFSEEISGEGKKKLSEIWNILLEKGYDQFKSQSFSLTYHEISNTVFVSDNSLFGDDENTLISLNEGEKIIVVDGQTKAEFSMEDFAGIDADELSLLHVKEKFVEINPLYEGCKMFFDNTVMVCYPVLSDISEKDFAEENYTSYIKEGVVHSIVEESYADLKGIYGEVSQKSGGVDVLVCKAGNGTVFVSFRSYNGYKPGNSSATNSAKNDKKKVEKKFKLPLKVFVANWGQEYIVSDEDLKKDKATLEEVRTFLGEKNKIFKDKSRKIDHLYDAEAGRLSVMFVSGSKGCELIRSEKEYEEVRRGTSFFDGVYTEAPHENVRVRVLPAGNFLTFTGKGIKGGELHRMEWERKLPKIPSMILDEIISIFRKDLRKEAAARVYYHKKTGEFSVKEAGGERSKDRINYLYDPDLDIMLGDKVQVLDVHSHNTFAAFFSDIDNRDDAGYPCLSAVIGKLQDERPEIKFRAGVDGLFTAYPVNEMFDI